MDIIQDYIDNVNDPDVLRQKVHWIKIQLNVLREVVNPLNQRIETLEGQIDMLYDKLWRVEKEDSDED